MQTMYCEDILQYLQQQRLLGVVTARQISKDLQKDITIIYISLRKLYENRLVEIRKIVENGRSINGWMLCSTATTFI